jgi:hypothetical protein
LAAFWPQQIQESFEDSAIVGRTRASDKDEVSREFIHQLESIGNPQFKGTRLDQHPAACQCEFTQVTLLLPETPFLLTEAIARESRIWELPKIDFGPR